MQDDGEKDAAPEPEPAAAPLPPMLRATAAPPAPAPAAAATTNTAASRKKTRGALLSGLKNGALQKAVDKMEDDTSGPPRAAGGAPPPPPPAAAEAPGRAATATVKADLAAESAERSALKELVPLFPETQQYLKKVETNDKSAPKLDAVLFLRRCGLFLP